eukprot:3523064-Pleurochrysis_carterae.AAC.1
MPRTLPQASASQPRAALAGVSQLADLTLAAPSATFIALAANGLMLCLVAMMCQPLVLAHADGFTVVGANLSHATRRASTLT